MSKQKGIRKGRFIETDPLAIVLIKKGDVPPPAWEPVDNGGPGSGNFGHLGRPGERGGSGGGGMMAPDKGGAFGGGGVDKNTKPWRATMKAVKANPPDPKLHEAASAAHERAAHREKDPAKIAAHKQIAAAHVKAIEDAAKEGTKPQEAKKAASDHAKKTAAELEKTKQLLKAADKVVKDAGKAKTASPEKLQAQSVDAARQVKAAMERHGGSSATFRSVEKLEGGGATFEVRDWGQWRRDEGRGFGEDDFDEDDDFEVLSTESAKTVAGVVDSVSKEFPNHDISWDAGEKNWISVDVVPKAPKLSKVQEGGHRYDEFGFRQEMDEGQRLKELGD